MIKYITSLLNKNPYNLSPFERTFLGVYKAERNPSHRVVSDCYEFHKHTQNYYARRINIFARYKTRPYLLLKYKEQELAMIYESGIIKLMETYTKTNQFAINCILGQLNLRFLKKIDFPLDNEPKTIKLNFVR